MSNPMAPPRGGGPPMGGPPPGDPATRSVMNPVDMAGMVTDGTMRKGMSIGELLEGIGIKWDDPAETAMQKLSMQGKNSTALGKAQTRAQSPQAPGGMPAGGPGGMPPGGPGGLDGMIGR